NVFRRFPKELELNNAPEEPSVEGGPWAPRLVAHFWPKHATTPFSDPATGDEYPANLDELNFYKVRFAHQGHVMTFRPPPAYVQVFADLAGNEDEGENTLRHTCAANGMGVAFGGEIALYFTDNGELPASITERAALFDESPHAIADPAWTAASGVLGHFA